jgi:hypothetical protein
MGKDKLSKKGKAVGAFFTDDGFAIGALPSCCALQIDS